MNDMDIDGKFRDAIVRITPDLQIIHNYYLLIGILNKVNGFTIGESKTWINQQKFNLDYNKKPKRLFCVRK